MTDEEVQILWDPMTKTVLVVKGDQIVPVPGTFTNRVEAIEAGLAMGRNLGWIANGENTF